MPLPAQPPPPLVLREPEARRRGQVLRVLLPAQPPPPRVLEGAGGATRRAVVVGAAAAPPLRVLAPAPCLLPTRAASAPCLCRAGVLFFVARLLQRGAAGVSFTISST